MILRVPNSTERVEKSNDRSRTIFISFRSQRATMARSCKRCTYSENGSGTRRDKTSDAWIERMQRERERDGSGRQRWRREADMTRFDAHLDSFDLWRSYFLYFLLSPLLFLSVPRRQVNSGRHGHHHCVCRSPMSPAMQLKCVDLTS